ncbi:hypothetical protein HRbin36_00661 [bacterium HR36]|nr:hypothetical protein HRbin36_00661 [bacterium HR36]
MALLSLWKLLLTTYGCIFRKISRQKPNTAAIEHGTEFYAPPPTITPQNLLTILKYSLLILGILLAALLLRMLVANRGLQN